MDVKHIHANTFMRISLWCPCWQTNSWSSYPNSVSNCGMLWIFDINMYQASAS